jgi:hypothetical protein
MKLEDRNLKTVKCNNSEKARPEPRYYRSLLEPRPTRPNLEKKKKKRNKQKG